MPNFELNLNYSLSSLLFYAVYDKHLAFTWITNIKNTKLIFQIVLCNLFYVFIEHFTKEFNKCTGIYDPLECKITKQYSWTDAQTLRCPIMVLERNLPYVSYSNSPLCIAKFIQNQIGRLTNGFTSWQIKTFTTMI